MKIIKEEYSSMSPNFSNFTDPIILAMAWKKAHRFIRSKNWFFDMLELDISAANLNENLHKWSSELRDNSYTPEPARLVLAPKSQKWFFTEDVDDWKLSDKDSFKIRKLAYINIKDQTASTAIMMFLANAIESLQGNTDNTNFMEAQHDNVYSYGNRLQCDWKGKKDGNNMAQFSWGSSNTYRKYFEDYRYFLSRSKGICDHYASALQPNERLIVMNFDLSNFFGSVEINPLIQQLKKLYEFYQSENVESLYNSKVNKEDVDDFWVYVERSFNWKWDKQDLASNESYTNELGVNQPIGLPQGLVASGFLANAYLINFDKKMGEKINVNDLDDDLRILDYCRYVDDIRLVIKYNKQKNSRKKVEKLITTILKKSLDEYQDEIGANEKRLKVNDDKTKTITYEQLSGNSNVSITMEAIQNRVSGTSDREELENITAELISLLRISDIFNESKNKPTNGLQLSKIAIPESDIQDDTIKRFAAIRLVEVLQRQKELLVDDRTIVNAKIENKKLSAEQILSYDFKSNARKLIGYWSQDPSLFLLLQCGFELYPGREFLDPVIEVLKLKLDSNDFTERKTVEFVISYLLRSSAIFIGTKPKNYYPRNANITQFRSTMGSFAKDILLNDNAPWYIHQQAILFLLTNQNYGFKIKKEKMLESYKYLYDSALYFQYKSSLEKRVITSFVAQQINANHEKYVTWFIDIIKSVKKKQAIRIFNLIKDNRPDLYKAILKDPEAQKKVWYEFVPKSDRNSIYYHSRSSEPIKSNQFIPLGSVIQNKNNPFKQENALLKLIAAILKSDDIINRLKVGFDLNSILVRSDDWGNIQDPRTHKVEVRLESQSSSVERSTVAESLDWIKEDYKWLNNLGKLIRSAFTGEYDYTVNANTTNDIGVYKGIQSNSLIRSFSLINIGDGITNTEVPITPWLSELLYSLLQWPGIEQWNNHIIELNAVEDANDLLLIINSRLEYQKKLYGVSSNLPVYSIPITQSSLDDSSSLRFAIVQTMLPQVEDFNEKDPISWSDNYRQAHKDHIASICHLIHKHVMATNTVEKLNKNTQVRKDIDIIVFPELSVHPDDVHLLERLSNDTGSHIFAGLLFHKESGDNIVNQGIWILRDRKKDDTNLIKIKQGKYHMTSEEKKMGIQSFRPYQLLVELIGKNKKVCLSSSICYDATDIALAADLKNLTDIYIVAALNRDINTFDNMVAYLHYHMYQPIVLANSGEFGGSTAQAPYSGHDKIIAHVHGNQQIAVSLFDVDPDDFKKTHGVEDKKKRTKTPPAG